MIQIQILRFLKCLALESISSTVHWNFKLQNYDNTKNNSIANLELLYARDQNYIMINKRQILFG